jgi:predicted  nucleic acid-binding Zn-ribbon protein
VKQTAALYQLQTLDSEIDSIQQRLSVIERELNQNEVVRRAQAALQRAEDSLRGWRTRMTDLELERRQLSEEAGAIEERLYSGRVHNPRELNDMQHKQAELRRRYERLEEPVIEAMLEIEGGEQAVEEAQAELERVTSEQADTIGELQAERRSLTATLKERQAEVDQAREQVEPEHLRTYDMLRRRPGGLAVVAITPNGECMACGVQVTSSMRQQIRRGEVLACTTCERLLFHP